MTKKREAKPKLTSWDPAEHIKTEKDMIAYLDAALEDGDPKLIVTVLGYIARSKGMAKVARKAGVGRESLYKSLSEDGNPGFMTIVKLVRAIGYTFTLKLAA